MSLFGHKTRLVMVGADAMDLCDSKAKYRHFDYGVVTVLVTDAAQRATFCGDDKYGAVSAHLLKEYEAMYPHVPGVQHLDYMVTSAREFTALLAHLRPELLLVDYHMEAVAQALPEGGLSLIQAVRAQAAFRALSIVMHTPEFDHKGRDPEFVEVEGLQFWLTRRHDSDAHHCFQRDLLDKRRIAARQKHGEEV